MNELDLSDKLNINIPVFIRNYEEHQSTNHNLSLKRTTRLINSGLNNSGHLSLLKHTAQGQQLDTVYVKTSLKDSLIIS